VVRFFGNSNRLGSISLTTCHLHHILNSQRRENSNLKGYMDRFAHCRYRISKLHAYARPGCECSITRQQFSRVRFRLSLTTSGIGDTWRVISHSVLLAINLLAGDFKKRAGRDLGLILGVPGK